MKLTKDEKKRFWMHFPLGVFNGLLFIFPPAGAALEVAFLAYEYIQEWRKEDWSFKDVIGWVFGLAVGLTIVTAAVISLLVLILTGVI